VHVLDERTLAFPAYDGNGMFLSTGNVLVNPEVGLLFIWSSTPPVPREEVPPPVPDWKRRDWARDVLPAGDPAADPARVSREATRRSPGAS
jgi:hypothetical protein